MVKIFCDGVFDLFHEGHLEHFKKIHKLFDDVYLFVGVMPDKKATDYKRKPIFNEKQRISLLNSCKYVHECTTSYPLIMTEEFMETNKIDYIVHAFSNKEDELKQQHFFEVPVKLNKMIIVDYHVSISTTEIINEWHNIWTKKGLVDSNDFMLLNGYENTEFCPEKSSDYILKILDIKPSDKVLEIGCGGGNLTRFFKDKCDYYGIDYSRSLVNKNIQLTNSKIFCSEAKTTFFKNNYFDKIFCVGVFEYFENKQYSNDVLDEIDRISKNNSKIAILDVRNKTHTKRLDKHIYEGDFQHLVYTKEDFYNHQYQEIETIWDSSNRFSFLKVN